MITFFPSISHLKKREILFELKKELSRKEINLLLGTRQAGKTSLLYLLLDYLLHEERVNPSQIFFFDLENINELEQLERCTDFRKFPPYLKSEGADLKKKIYLFIDEIQYLSHPSNFLKYLYDHLGLKFIVSGSSSLEIKKKFTDRLTGRQRTFLVRPLSFQEFLHFKGKKRKKIKGLNHKQSLGNEGFFEELLEEFEEFVVFGSYPAVVLEKSFEEKKKILAGIYNLYVRKDIRDFEKVTDPQAFNHLVRLLGFQIGSLVNEVELSISSRLSRPAIKKHLFLLENTFIIKLIFPYFNNPRSELTKMPKVFFTDNGLRNFIVNNFNALKERVDAGFLIENAVFGELSGKAGASEEVHFWRTKQKQEVDFVWLLEKRKPLPIEVKYQSFKKARIPGGMASFLRRYQPDKGVVVTRDFFGEKTFGQSRVLFLPACFFALMFENILENGLK